MCLAIPGRIVSIDGTTARIDYNGVTGEADLTLIPDAEVGDYVLVHAGFAIEEVEAEDAEEIGILLGELSDALGEE